MRLPRRFTPRKDGEEHVIANPMNGFVRRTSDAAILY